VEIYRTPPERFEGLPDFPYVPRYREWRDMRLAHVDEGEGPPVVLLHGEPTWSFLYRKVMISLLESGFRCIVPDLPGFGRSDKVLDVAWYSYDNHTEAITALLDELDLHDVTMVVHDWGGPIGLRVATTKRRDRVSRIVAMDTGVFTGHQPMSASWLRFRDFVAGHPDLPIKLLIRGGCKKAPPREVLAAYEAPFPNEASKAGARAFPSLLPLTPDAPGAETGREVVKALADDPRPALIIWADSDPVLPLEPVGRAVQKLFSTAPELTVIHEAGHYLQEDQGEQVGRVISKWLTTASSDSH
jgi:haloalkane dehalogenase